MAKVVDNNYYCIASKFRIGSSNYYRYSRNSNYRCIATATRVVAATKSSYYFLEKYTARIARAAATATTTAIVALNSSNYLVPLLKRQLSARSQ